jgi:2-keto-4-pentenoate hydratase
VSDERVSRGMRTLLAERRERIGAGERPLGWKVGFGSPANLARLRLSGPLVGFLTDRGLLEDPATCALAGWTNPVVEAEIAVHFAADVLGGATDAEAAAAIDGLGPAIELADIDPSRDDPEDILAANIFHRHVILGPVSTSVHSAGGVRGRVFRNGIETAVAEDAEALPGPLLAVVRRVADVCAEHGERLRAGDVLIAGSVVPPQPAAPGDVFRVELSPLGALQVSFT